MIAVRFDSLCLPAHIAASQTDPSLISPSPMTTKTRLSRFRIRAASAMPTPIDRPWPECAGRSLDARNLAGLRMAAQDRFATTERIQRLDGKEALVGQDHVERDTAVALAQDHAVAVAPLRFRGRKRRTSS